MQLSVPTLIVVDLYVLLLVALLMLFAWRSGRREPTLGYLCLTLFLGVASTALGALRNLGIDYVPIVLGNVLLVLAMAFNSSTAATGTDGRYANQMPPCSRL